MGWLSHLRVLDASVGAAGPFCARLLADLGADVIKLEPPGGDVSRTWGPFPNHQPHAEKSASFLFFNAGKRSVVVDVEDAAALARLVADCDIVIGCERLRSLGIGDEQLRRWRSDLIYTSVTGFGDQGPYAEFENSHLVACAAGGWAQLCGVPQRPPLQVGGSTSLTLTGAYAAAATLLAVHGRAAHGGGDYIEVSAQQAVLCGAQIPSLLFEYRGIVAERYSSVGSGAGAGYMLPTREGTIGLNALTHLQWHALCGFLGRDDIATDERWQGISWATPDERLEEIRGIFREALADRTAEQLFHDAQAVRVPFGLVPDLAGLFALQPMLERKFFQEIDHPEAGSFAIPGVPFHSDGFHPEIGRPPLLGEHTEAVLAELAVAPPADRASNERPKRASNPLPLEGLKVVDCSMFFAGPALGQILADAGADVIKIESLQRIDGWRGAGTINATDTIPGWEASPYFNWINRNKRDVTLNLTDPRGVAAARNLIRDADVLIENYTPRVMDRFGLGWASVHELNPRLVMISLSGFGANVAWRDYVAFGMSTEQMSGMAHLTGYAGDEPIFTGMTGGDLYAGVMGAVDVLAALSERNRTGLGRHLDLSQIEACNLYVGDAMTGYALTAVDPGRRGNNDDRYPIQDCFETSNGWLALTCRDESEVMRLAEIVGAAPDTLDHARIREWARGGDKFALMHELQSEGIAASAVYNGPDLLNDPHLAERGALLAQDRPGLGVRHYPAQPYRHNHTEAAPNQRAPMLGEHLEAILQEAGLQADEIVDLVVDDVTGTVPLAAR